MKSLTLLKSYSIKFADRGKIIIQVYNRRSLYCTACISLTNQPGG